MEYRGNELTASDDIEIDRAVRLKNILRIVKCGSYHITAAINQAKG